MTWLDVIVAVPLVPLSSVKVPDPLDGPSPVIVKVVMAPVATRLDATSVAKVGKPSPKALNVELIGVPFCVVSKKKQPVVEAAVYAVPVRLVPLKLGTVYVPE